MATSFWQLCDNFAATCTHFQRNICEAEAIIGWMESEPRNSFSVGVAFFLQLLWLTMLEDENQKYSELFSATVKIF